MAQKNEASILILALLITLGAIAGGGWWLTRSLLSSSTGNPSLPNSNGTPSSPIQPLSEPALEQLLSVGDRLLIPERTSTQKQAGISAIASGTYDQAVGFLEAALAENRNDPEARIYLNNARIGTRPAYTIAVATPIGSAVDAAEELLRGVAQAQTELNQSGGIAGIPLRVMIVDDQDDAGLAAQLAQALVNDPTVLGVVGHFSSSASLAAGAVYQQSGLVMISPTSTSVELSQLGDAVFRTVQSDRFAADGLAQYWLNTMNGRNVAVFYNSESSYSNSLKDAFTSAVLTGGGQVVAEFDLVRGDFNANTDVEQAIQRGADTLMLAANTPTRTQALQVIAANRQRLDLLGGDSLYNAEVLQLGGAAAVGMVVAAPWHRAADPSNPFPAEARQLWGGDVSWRSALSYDATEVFIAALRQNPTRSGVLQALNRPNFSVNGASGNIQFLPSGDRNRATQLVIIQPGTQTGYGYDFVPVP